MRLFEFCIHISYRLTIQKWRITAAEDKKKVQERKRKIQKICRDELGLIVDRPKPGGAGNSNDGNTARTAFRLHEKFAEICGLDHELVFRFHIIMVALNCGFPLDRHKFEMYLRETGELFVKLYNWYYMPVGLHVLLMHWKDQDEAVPLPDLWKTEETGEGNNKFSRNFREDHARKDDRVHTMTDVFHRLCEAGDVLVSSMSVSERDKRRKRKNLLPEVI